MTHELRLSCLEFVFTIRNAYAKYMLSFIERSKQNMHSLRLMLIVMELMAVVGLPHGRCR